MSSTPWPLSARTMKSIALATLSQWPHQRTAQRNRNDRLFIIAQPLCLRGKSIIKTRLTAKITAVSSIVLERANFFFFLKGLLTSPASPWCNLLPISNPIAFWNWIYLTHSHSEWTLLPVKKKRDSVWNCLRSREVSDSSGTSLCLPLTFQQEECPHYREGLGASGGEDVGGRESTSWTAKQGSNMRTRMGILVKSMNVYREQREGRSRFM